MEIHRNCVSGTLFIFIFIGLCAASSAQSHTNYDSYYIKALEDNNKSVETNQLNGTAWYYRGYILIELGRYNDAIQALDMAIELLSKPSSDSNRNYLEGAWYDKGLALWMLHQLNESLEALDEAIKINPDNANALLLAGRIFYEQNDFEKANEYQDKAIKKDNSKGIAWFNKGLVDYALGDYNESIRSYYNAIQNMATQNQGSITVAWNNMGTAFYVQKRYKEAIEKYNKAIKLNSSFPEAYYNKGLALQQLGIQEKNNRSRYLEAIDLYNVALNLKKSDYIDAMNNKGIALSALNRSAQANEAFIKVRAMKSSEQTSLRIFQSTIIAVFLIGLISTLPKLLKSLLSKNQDLKMRKLLLLFQSGYLVIIAVFLSLILWSSEIATSELQVRFVLILILSILLFSFILPYFSGWQRSKSWRIHLMEKKLKWINQLLEILDFPTTRRYILKLRLIQNEIEAEQMNFIKHEELTEYFKTCRIHNPNNDHEFDSDISKSVDISGSFLNGTCEIDSADPSVEYINFLNNLIERIEECIDEFESLKIDIWFELAKGYALAYRTRKEEILTDLEKEMQSKPLLWVGLTFILTALLGQVLGNFSGSVGTAINYVGNFSATLSQASVLHP